MIRSIIYHGSRVLVTLLVVAAAIWAGFYVWENYMERPWTRDGRVRALVLNIAPDVSGLVTAMPLKDNQRVKKGDLLFAIDPARYRLALEEANAAVKSCEDNLAQKVREMERRKTLLDSSVLAQEDFEKSENVKILAESALRQAVAARERAELDLSRTEVKSPVNGYVTNLQLDIGDYANAGKPMLALVNSDSFYVAGYFEETKLGAIHPGAKVRIKLMAHKEELSGHVESIAPAIVDRENLSGDDLVANVNPTFSWVRLAQRIPVRISIDKIPEGLRITAGMTATVIVEDVKKKEGR